jgi:hypothetical protein
VTDIFFFALVGCIHIPLMRATVEALLDMNENKPISDEFAGFVRRSFKTEGPVLQIKERGTIVTYLVIADADLADDQSASRWAVCQVHNRPKSVLFRCLSSKCHRMKLKLVDCPASKRSLCCHLVHIQQLHATAIEHDTFTGDQEPDENPSRVNDSQTAFVYDHELHRIIPSPRCGQGALPLNPSSDCIAWIKKRVTGWNILRDNQFDPMTSGTYVLGSNCEPLVTSCTNDCVVPLTLFATGDVFIECNLNWGMIKRSKLIKICSACHNTYHWNSDDEHIHTFYDSSIGGMFISTIITTPPMTHPSLIILLS